MGTKRRIPSYEKRVHKITIRLNSHEYRNLLRFCKHNNCTMSTALRSGLEWLTFKMRQELAFPKMNKEENVPIRRNRKKRTT